MIYKVIGSLFGFCLLLAISLSLLGVTHVEFGRPFMYFMRDLSADLNNFKISIPTIPMIPLMDDATGADAVLEALKQFINGFSVVLNFIITAINVIIDLLEFCFLAIRRLIIFRDELANYGG